MSEEKETYEINRIKCPYCGLIFQDENYYDNPGGEPYEIECDCGKCFDCVWSAQIPEFTAYQKDQGSGIMSEEIKTYTCCNCCSKFSEEEGYSCDYCSEECAVEDDEGEARWKF